MQVLEAQPAPGGGARTLPIRSIRTLLTMSVRRYIRWRWLHPLLAEFDLAGRGVDLRTMVVAYAKPLESARWRSASVISTARAPSCLKVGRGDV